MKNFLKNHGLWILFATAVVAVALALMSYFSANSSPLVNLSGMIAAPFRAVYTSITNWIVDKQNYYQDTTALKEENEALKIQIAKMEAEIRQAQADREENALFREVLELRKQRRDLELEAAAITERATSNWTSSFTLNRGTEHGVETGDCVITPEGYLAGIVYEAGTNWCTVLTIVDTDISLGAQVFRSRTIGVAEGDFALMGSGRLKLNYLPAGTQLLSGDLIVTSGLAGYYPAGLVIGSVEEIRTDDSGATQYAVLAPSAQLEELTEVFVIKSFDIVD